nr:ATP-binding protein [Phormidium sp. CCY1219]
MVAGKTTPSAEIAPAEAQNRFNLVLQKFIRVFASAEHPLVLFIDDLQWADGASLKLLELLLSDPELKYLFAIGAYRDNEVTPVHPLMLSVDRIKQTEAVVNRIEVPPLRREDLNRLVAEALSCSEKRSQPLSQLVFQKTEGNPFFATQFLKSLYERELLQFDRNSGYWHCDLTRVKALAVSDNVVEFMAAQLQRLPQTTQTVLKLAACIGHQFDLETLAIVNEQSQADTSAQLWTALQSGLVIPESELYKFFQSEEENEAAIGKGSAIQYKFLHDRVSEAAYSLIPDAEKKTTHLKLGRRLLNNTAPEEVEDKIFTLVNQLNVGADLIENQREKTQLAGLNLRAGRKAKSATAYDSALQYLNVGLELLTTNSWRDRYDLTLSLHVEAAEAAYLSTDFDRMEDIAHIVLENATTLLDRVKVYEVKIQAYTAQNKQLEALQITRNVMQLLGVELPEQPTFDDIQTRLGETFAHLSGKPVAELIHLPAMSDPDKKAAMGILNTAIAPAYQSAPLLLPLLVFAEINLSLDYGNTDESAYAYACYGLILCGIVGDIDTGHQFGQLALQVLERFENQELKARTLMVVNNNVRLWKEPMSDALTPLIAAYESGLETGDLEYAALSAYNYCINSYFVGKGLAELEVEMASYSELLHKLKQTTPLNYLKMYWQVVLNLIETSPEPMVLEGKVYDEEKMLPLHERASDRYGLCCLYLHKLILSYLFRHGDRAVENAAAASNYLDALTAVYPLPLFHFYESLSALLVYPKLSATEREDILAKVESNQEKMKKWAAFAPGNFQHKYALVQAEKARVMGQVAEAISAYDRAIVLARENGYIQEEALANELAGEFHFARKSQQIAQFYLTDAYYGYARWGATAKVKHLEEQYPQILARITQRSPVCTANTRETLSTFATNTTTNTDVWKLDLNTVMKASLALSEELVLDKFLHKLMRVILENAGAEKGFLIVEEAGQLLVKAGGSIEEAAVTIPPDPIPIEDAQMLPVAIANYVARTGEILVLKNAARESIFATDAYIAQVQPQSILCLPIVHHGKSVAILYLENSLSDGVFTRDRLEVLQMLCAQAAISLENALLYQNLQQSLQDLKEAQLQLVQSEKMSTLGQLIAGVAHEINNPVSFVHGNLDPAQEYVQDLLHHLQLYRKYYPEPMAEIEEDAEAIDLEYLMEDLPEMLSSMKLGTDRIREIVKSLKNFSRKDTAKLQTADIHAGIDSTLLILSNRLKAKGSKPAIAVMKEYGTLPKVQCYPGQLNQVFMNLIANAIDALESSVPSPNDNGQTTHDYPQMTIRIRTEVKEDSVAIWIADNGCGMTPTVQDKLFKTFFTTKPEGKGTGLGLSISHQIIVDRHRGTLSCTSQEGEGTEFCIEIPISQDNSAVE